MYTNVLNRKGGRFLVISELVNTASLTPASQRKYAEMITEDMTPRKQKVPVVVEGKRFESTIAGARYLAAKHAIATKCQFASDDVVQRYRVQIRNWCNADNVEGYYWAE